MVEVIQLFFLYCYVLIRKHFEKHQILRSNETINNFLDNSFEESNINVLNINPLVLLFNNYSKN